MEVGKGKLWDVSTISQLGYAGLILFLSILLELIFFLALPRPAVAAGQRSN